MRNKLATAITTPSTSNEIKKIAAMMPGLRPLTTLLVVCSDGTVVSPTKLVAIAPGATVRTGDELRKLTIATPKYSCVLLSRKPSSV